MGASANEQAIYDYLTNVEHFTPLMAADALGNFQVESGFDPTSYNARENAIGIGQWEGSRKVALDALAAQMGLKDTDLRVQLAYLGQELNGNYHRVVTALLGARTPAEGAAIWDAQYENSAGTTRTQRVNDATAIYQSIKGGKLGTGVAAGSEPTPPFATAPTPPLTAPQRASMITYLKAYASFYGQSVPGNLTALSDAQLAKTYNDAVTTAKAIGHGGGLLPSDNPFGIGNLLGGALGAAASGIDWFGPVWALVLKAIGTLFGIGLVIVGAAAAAHSQLGG